ncbi:hypothetical protein [Saccharopolyspora rosea]|uniref:hypothetical protein n=1 Tax=Saccharopolyspora rosea TaxID=524884 RepID=UPI0021DA7E55|nr:hypothetical protein [Saccharopolyspora rosea]
MTTPQGPWQQGGYPQYPQSGGFQQPYPQYQQNPYAAPPVPQQEMAGLSRPKTVEGAFWIAIIVPLAVTVISVVGYLLLFNWADSAMASSVRDLGGSGQELERTLSFFKAGIMFVFALFTVVYLVLTFLWILFGFKMRAGRNWARVTLTVFASLFVLFSVYLLVNGGVGAGGVPSRIQPPTAFAVLTYVQGGLGLVAMVGFLVLAYAKPSNWYFQAAAHLR